MSGVQRKISDYFSSTDKVARLAPVDLIPVCTDDDTSPRFRPRSKRNRLEPKTLKNLMLIKLEGPDRKQFQFEKAVLTWDEKKTQANFQI